jgi:hypothetical protein
MPFGTAQQPGNRTSLAGLFRNTPGAPQQAANTPQPDMLLQLLQSLLSGQDFQGGGFNQQAGFNQPAAGPGAQQTSLSSLTAQPRGQFDFSNNSNSLANPVGRLLNQRFVR